MALSFSTFFEKFFKARFIVLIVWACILITCCFFALDFLSLTNLSFIPPDGSDAAKAEEALKKYFPDDAKQSRFIVLMQLTNKKNKDYPTILSNNWTMKTTEKIIKSAKSFKEDKKMLADYMGRYTFDYPKDDPYALQFLEATFVSSNNRSSLLILSTKEKGTQKVMDWIRYMRDELDAMDKVDGTFTLDLIGFDTLDFDMTDGATNDMKFMDAVSLPLALVVFIAIMQSLSVAVVPVLAVGASVLLSFTIMNPIARAMSIPSYCPAIMMSIEIAMSIDYSLFLLTRFHEEIGRGVQPKLASEKMLRYSGETILKSGLVFTVCLASLIVFPLKVIKALGIGMVIGLQSTMLIALTLIPSLINAGLPFFAISGLIPCIAKSPDGKCGCQCTCCCGRGDGVRRPRKRDNAMEKFEKEKASHWFKFADWVSKPLHAAIIIAAVLAICVPFCLGMLKWKVVINEDHVLPRSSPTHDAIARFSKEWPVGELYTFDVVAVPKAKNGTVFCPDFYTTFHQLAVEITTNASDYFNMSGVLSPADLSDFLTIDYDTAYFLVATNEFAYSQVFKQQVNKERTAAKMTLASNVNPNLNASEIPAVIRPILKDFSKDSNYSFYLTNQIVNMADAVSYTFDALPYIIIAMAGVIVVMVVVAFQAPALSLHMLFTIALTLVWAFGVESAIFATDWFYWVSDNLKLTPGISWVLPILALPVLIGLALDYNIFLFTRIHEFRVRGWAPRAAMIMGVTKGSQVILFAGVIMAVAFSGMDFSGIMLLNQGGVILAIGVLFDTYLVSTTLNPALIYVFDFLNYWPRRFPTKHEDPAEFTEDLVEEGEIGSTDKIIQPIASETTPLTANSINYDSDAFPA